MVSSPVFMKNNFIAVLKGELYDKSNQIWSWAHSLLDFPTPLWLQLIASKAPKKAKKRSKRIRNLSSRKPASVIACVLVSEGRAGFLERMRPPLVRTTGLS